MPGDALVDSLAEQLECSLRDIATLPAFRESALLQLLLEEESIDTGALSPAALSSLVHDALDWCTNVSALRPPPLSRGPLGSQPNPAFALGYLQRPYCKALCRALASWYVYDSFPYAQPEVAALADDFGQYLDVKASLGGLLKGLVKPALQDNGRSTAAGDDAGDAGGTAVQKCTSAAVYRHSHTPSLSAWQHQQHQPPQPVAYSPGRSPVKPSGFAGHTLPKPLEASREASRLREGSGPTASNLSGREGGHGAAAGGTGGTTAASPFGSGWDSSVGGGGTTSFPAAAPRRSTGGGASDDSYVSPPLSPLHPSERSLVSFPRCASVAITQYAERSGCTLQSARTPPNPFESAAAWCDDVPPAAADGGTAIASPEPGFASISFSNTSGDAAAAAAAAAVCQGSGGSSGDVAEAAAVDGTAAASAGMAANTAGGRVSHEANGYCTEEEYRAWHGHPHDATADRASDAAAERTSDPADDRAVDGRPAGGPAASKGDRVQRGGSYGVPQGVSCGSLSGSPFRRSASLPFEYDDLDHVWDFEALPLVPFSSSPAHMILKQYVNQHVVKAGSSMAGSTTATTLSAGHSAAVGIAGGEDGDGSAAAPFSPSAAPPQPEPTRKVLIRAGDVDACAEGGDASVDEQPPPPQPQPTSGELLSLMSAAAALAAAVVPGAARSPFAAQVSPFECAAVPAGATLTPFGSCSGSSQPYDSATSGVASSFSTASGSAHSLHSAPQYLLQASMHDSVTSSPRPDLPSAKPAALPSPFQKSAAFDDAQEEEEREEVRHYDAAEAAPAGAAAGAASPLASSSASAHKSTEPAAAAAAAAGRGVPRPPAASPFASAPVSANSSTAAAIAASTSSRPPASSPFESAVGALDGSEAAAAAPWAPAASPFASAFASASTSTTATTISGRRPAPSPFESAAGSDHGTAVAAAVAGSGAPAQSPFASASVSMPLSASAASSAVPSPMSIKSGAVNVHGAAQPTTSRPLPSPFESVAATPHVSAAAAAANPAASPFASAFASSASAARPAAASASPFACASSSSHAAATNTATACASPFVSTSTASTSSHAAAKNTAAASASLCASTSSASTSSTATAALVAASVSPFAIAFASAAGAPSDAPIPASVAGAPSTARVPAASDRRAPSSPFQSEFGDTATQQSSGQVVAGAETAPPAAPAVAEAAPARPAASPSEAAPQTTVTRCSASTASSSASSAARAGAPATIASTSSLGSSVQAGAPAAAALPKIPATSPFGPALSPASTTSGDKAPDKPPASPFASSSFAATPPHGATATATAPSSHTGDASHSAGDASRSGAASCEPASSWPSPFESAPPFQAHVASTSTTTPTTMTARKPMPSPFVDKPSPFHAAAGAAAAAAASLATSSSTSSSAAAAAASTAVASSAAAAAAPNVGSSGRLPSPFNIATLPADQTSASASPASTDGTTNGAPRTRGASCEAPPPARSPSAVAGVTSSSTDELQFGEASPTQGLQQPLKRTPPAAAAAAAAAAPPPSETSATLAASLQVSPASQATVSPPGSSTPLTPCDSPGQSSAAAAAAAEAAALATTSSCCISTASSVSASFSPFAAYLPLFETADLPSSPAVSSPASPLDSVSGFGGNVSAGNLGQPPGPKLRAPLASGVDGPTATGGAATSGATAVVSSPQRPHQLSHQVSHQSAAAQATASVSGQAGVDGAEAVTEETGGAVASSMAASAKLPAGSPFASGTMAADVVAEASTALPPSHSAGQIGDHLDHEEEDDEARPLVPHVLPGGTSILSSTSADQPAVRPAAYAKLAGPQAGPHTWHTTPCDLSPLVEQVTILEDLRGVMAHVPPALQAYCDSAASRQSSSGSNAPVTAATASAGAAGKTVLPVYLTEQVDSVMCDTPSWLNAAYDGDDGRGTGSSTGNSHLGSSLRQSHTTVSRSGWSTAGSSTPTGGAGGGGVSVDRAVLAGILIDPRAVHMLLGLRLPSPAGGGPAGSARLPSLVECVVAFNQRHAPQSKSHITVGAYALSQHTVSDSAAPFWEAASGPECLRNALANRVLAKVLAGAACIRLCAPGAAGGSSSSRRDGPTSSCPTGTTATAAGTPRVGSADDVGGDLMGQLAGHVGGAVAGAASARSTVSAAAEVLALGDASGGTAAGGSSIVNAGSGVMHAGSGIAEASGGSVAGASRLAGPHMAAAAGAVGGGEPPSTSVLEVRVAEGYGARWLVSRTGGGSGGAGVLTGSVLARGTGGSAGGTSDGSAGGTSGGGASGTGSSAGGSSGGGSSGTAGGTGGAAGGTSSVLASGTGNSAGGTSDGGAGGTSAAGVTVTFLGFVDPPSLDAHHKFR